jgi:hypothetical protein
VEAHAGSGESLQVLVAEDLADVRDTLSDVTRLLGHAGRAVGSAAEARPLLAAAYIDAVLIDLKNARHGWFCAGDRDPRGRRAEHFVDAHPYQRRREPGCWPGLAVQWIPAKTKPNLGEAHRIVCIGAIC